MNRNYGNPGKMVSDYKIIDSPGKRFENDVISTLRKMYSEGITDTVGTKMDTELGVDFILEDEIGADTTLNFENKDHMPLIRETNIPATLSQNFKLGLRTGNNYKGYTEFEKPVIVVGLNMDAKTYDANDYDITVNIKKHGRELMDAIFNFYYDVDDFMAEESKEIPDVKENKNAKYTQKQQKKSKYQQLIEYFGSTMDDITKDKTDDNEFC